MIKTVILLMAKIDQLDIFLTTVERFRSGKGRKGGRMDAFDMVWNLLVGSEGDNIIASAGKNVEAYDKLRFQLIELLESLEEPFDKARSLIKEAKRSKKVTSDTAKQFQGVFDTAKGIVGKIIMLVQSAKRK